LGIFQKKLLQKRTRKGKKTKIKVWIDGIADFEKPMMCERVNFQII